MSLTPAQKRLKKARTLVHQDLQYHHTVLDPQSENKMIWTATIQGPNESPFQGGKFKIKLIFPDKYPFLPCKIVFVTKIFHPQIINGEEFHLDMNCLDCGNFGPFVNANHVLLDLYVFLKTPCFETSCCEKKMKFSEEYRKGFNEIAKKWTQKCAGEQPQTGSMN